MSVLDVPGPPNFAWTLVRSIPTQINRFWGISGTLKNCSFLFIPFILGIWGLISVYQTSGSFHIVPTNHIQPTKVAGTRSKNPKSLSQGWLQNPGYFGAKLGQKWSQAIVTVLDVPGPPNFAGTLVGSIPTQINRFWVISGTLKNCSFLVIPFILGIWGLISVYQTSGPLHIVPTNHIQPTKVAGTQNLTKKTTVPKLSQNCPLAPIWLQKSGFINSRAQKYLRSELPDFCQPPRRKILQIFTLRKSFRNTITHYFQNLQSHYNYFFQLPATTTLILATFAHY